MSFSFSKMESVCSRLCSSHSQCSVISLREVPGDEEACVWMLCFHFQTLSGSFIVFTWAHVNTADRFEIAAFNLFKNDTPSGIRRILSMKRWTHVF